MDRHRDRADARDFLGRSRAGGEERGSPESQMEPFARAARSQGRTAAQPRGLDRQSPPRERKLAANSPPHLHTPLSPSRARAAPRMRRRAQRDMQRRAQRATHLAAKPPRRHITPARGKLVASFARDVRRAVVAPGDSPTPPEPLLEPGGPRFSNSPRPITLAPAPYPRATLL